MTHAVRSVRDLAVLVRAARIAHGWTQEELAQRAQVSRKWLSQLEQGGHHRAELAHVLSVLRALEVPLTAELPGPVPPVSGAAPDNPRLDPFDLDAHLDTFLMPDQP